MVPEDVKTERLARLQALLNEQQIEFNRSFEGKTMPVLLERAGKREGQLIGRSPYMQSVYVQSPPHRIGRIAEVTIDEGNANSLRGILKSSSTENAA